MEILAALVSDHSGDFGKMRAPLTNESTDIKK